MAGALSKKWFKRLTAAALGGLLIAATAQQSFAVINLDEPVSLTVNAGDVPAADFEGSEADLVVDLYKVADAVPVEGYDTYDLEVTEGFDVEDDAGSLKDAVEKGDNDYAAWQVIAQRAAKAALLGDEPMTATTQNAGTKFENLSAGLYLVVTRGSDLTDVEDYFKEFPAEDAAATDPTGAEASGSEYLSIARSNEYEYKFRPILVAVPGKGAGELSFDTADDEEWNPDVEITLNLKWKRDPRLTDFQIEKILPVCEDNGDAMFVFQVTATKVIPVEDGGSGQPKVVYNNVLSINFKAEKGEGEDAVYYVPDKKVLTIPDLPVGCTVEVKEIYSGSTYSVVGSDTWNSPHPLKVGEVQKASFENKHDDTHRGGGGITNRFEKGESSWNDPVVEKTSVTGGEDAA